jgi:4-amino-4-deoxy-L-arabinose transferase-like glycosyltransferase
VALWGVTEWYARLVPALIGIISLPILYFPIKKILDARISLVALLLLALSPWHLYWSQNARFYVALLLFYTLALLTFYLGLEKDRPLYFLASLLLLGLAVKERLIALFFVPVILSYLLLLYVLPIEKPAGHRRRNLVLFFGPPGLVLALFFTGPYLLNLSAWFEGFGGGNNNPFWLLAGVMFYMGLPLTCAGALGALYLLFQKSRVGLLLSLNAVIPILLLMSISSFHYTANRYVFIVLASWVILAAVAAVELLRQSQAAGKTLAIGLLIILILDPLSANAFYYRYQNGNRDNWKAALEFVKERKQEGDLVVTINPEMANYYLQDKSTHFQEFDLSRVGEVTGGVWFVEDTIAQEAYPQVHIWLEQNAQPVANFDVHVQARDFRMRVYFYP